MMRPIMKMVFRNVMSGLAYHCATGEEIAEELPAKEELTKLIIT